MQIRKAFTLIELLVVVTIIGVMVALLLPAISSARASSRKSQCINNMRQLGIGIQNFCNNNRDYFPLNAFSSASKSWVYTLTPYYEGIDAIRICPDDPKGRERYEAKGTSYRLSNYVSSTSNIATRRLSKLKATSKSIIMYETAENSTIDAKADHAMPTRWFTNTSVDPITTVKKEIQLDRHHGTCANYLYADGHVETITEDQVVQWVASGYNFGVVQ